MPDDDSRDVNVDLEILDDVANWVTAGLGENDATVVVTTIEDRHVIAFVRRSNRWRGYKIASNAYVERLYGSSHGSVFIWVAEGVGDPPYAFSGFQVDAMPGRHFWASFEIPEDLNRDAEGNYDWRGEAFVFDDFNTEQGGNGAVLGSALIDRGDGERLLKFRYQTRDGGRSWTASSIVDQTQPVPGDYRSLELQNDQDMFRQLRVQAAML